MKTAATSLQSSEVRMKMMNDCTAVVIGAGLAGSEASWQLASRGIRVILYEMRPLVYTPTGLLNLSAPTVSGETGFQMPSAF